MLDNPPFSILSRIIDFYLARNIGFFLFAPSLTLFNYNSRRGVTAIVAAGEVVYENGASVETSFVTNRWPEDDAFIIAGDLNERIKAARKENKVDKSKRLLKYPPTVVNAATIGKLAKRGITMRAERSGCRWIRKLDCGQGLYGSGFLISERLAAERLAARKCYEYGLSPGELEIIKRLK